MEKTILNIYFCHICGDNIFLSVCKRCGDNFEQNDLIWCDGNENHYCADCGALLNNQQRSKV
jgi:hypothetical protein